MAGSPEFQADEIETIVAALNAHGLAVVRDALPADRVAEICAPTARLARLDRAVAKSGAVEPARAGDNPSTSSFQDALPLGDALDDHVLIPESLCEVFDLLQNSGLGQAARLYLRGEAGLLMGHCSLRCQPATDIAQALAFGQAAALASDRPSLVFWVPLTRDAAGLAPGDVVILACHSVHQSRLPPPMSEAMYGLALSCVAAPDSAPQYSGAFLPLHPRLDRRRSRRGLAAGQLRATVLVPTHRHAGTLPLAVASVLAQADDDVEVFIVGDGADDQVRAAGQSLADSDRRVRFFDYPKGARHGEENRHAALAEARGRIVCYQSDDDLWLPNHLDAMDDALSDADFAGGIHVNVGLDGRLRAYFFDLSRPELTDPWLRFEVNGFGAWASGGFGLTYAAHTLEAYRRLPEGWAAAPGLRPSQHTMWHKFARQPWCRMKSVTFATALHFPAFEREEWPMAQRAAELKHWSNTVARPDCWETICRGIMTEMGDRLFRGALADRSQREEERREKLRVIQDLESECEKVRAVTKQLEEETARRTADVRRLDAERQYLERALAATLNSRSWRMTTPLRALVDQVRQLRSRRGA